MLCHFFKCVVANHRHLKCKIQNLNYTIKYGGYGIFFFFVLFLHVLATRGFEIENKFTTYTELVLILVVSDFTSCPQSSTSTLSCDDVYKRHRLLILGYFADGNHVSDVKSR